MIDLENLILLFSNSVSIIVLKRKAATYAESQNWDINR